MTLLIINNELRIINDNLSVEMMVLLKEKRINIVRLNDTTHIFERLIIDNGKLYWIRIPNAKRLVYKGSIIYQ